MVGMKDYISMAGVTTFSYSKLLQYLFYSLLRPDHSWLISYDILTMLSVSSTADLPLIDYFSHNYSFWLIIYDILSQIDLVCVPDPLVYKLSVSIWTHTDQILPLNQINYQIWNPDTNHTDRHESIQQYPTCTYWRCCPTSEPHTAGHN